MSLASVLEQLSGRPARSLTESDGVSNCETPRRKNRDGTTLPCCAESAESDSMSYTCAGARPRTRARDVQLAERDSPGSRVSVSPLTLVTILKPRGRQYRRRWAGWHQELFPPPTVADPCVGNLAAESVEAVSVAREVETAMLVN